jgi:hypothetical protein
MGNNVSKGEYRVSFLLLAVLAGICIFVLFGHREHDRHRSVFAYRLPPGWQLVGRWESYPRGKLYEKIDGRETLFNEYGVLRLDCAAATVGALTFDVFIYHMANPDGALGVYLAASPAESREIDIAPMAGVAGGEVRAVVGRVYLEVQPQEKNVDEKLPIALAKTILAGTPPEKSSAGSILAMLPKAGRVNGSLAYNAESALGLNSLGKTYSATYEDGKPYDVLVRRISPAEGDKVLAAVRDEVKKFEGNVTLFQPGKLRAQVVGKDLLLVRDGSLLVGIYSDRNDLEALYEQLKAKRNGRK